MPISILRFAFHAALALAAGAGTVAGATNAPAKPAKQPANPAPKSQAAPRHDPADQVFRHAPMSAAVRTVAVALSPELHAGFDTELLRTHVAWKGSRLNLWGPPYHLSKDRYYCDFDGMTLFSNPPFFPWSAGSEPGPDLVKMPAGARYLGLSAKGGGATFLYELALAGGKTVRVHETHRVQATSAGGAVVRRLEIGPCDQDLWLLAHAEAGGFDAGVGANPGAVLIRREQGALLAAIRATGQAVWSPQVRQVDYEVVKWSEKKNDSERTTVRVTGNEARAYLKIPKHDAPVAVEIFSLVLSDADQAAGLAMGLINGITAAPNMNYPFRSEPDRAASAPKVFQGDKTLPLPTGDEFYRLEHFPLPKEINLQVNGLDFLPNGDLAACTWLGDVYIIEKPQGAPGAATYRHFAYGLCEPGGLKVIDGKIHVVQKQQLTRLSDTDGNGAADLYECINQDWGFTGNYHDFSFGPVLDRQGNFYVYRNGNRGFWDVPYMGWAVKISPDGRQLEGFCSGFRSPNGFGTWGPDRDLFMTDNQGNWIGVCTLNHLQKGRFFGYPSAWPEPKENYEAPPRFDPPAVWFPYKLSKSASEIISIDDDRFGPFKGQMLVGEWQNALVVRVALEKVNGEWQGAVFPFAKGFQSGVNRLVMGPDGKLYAGGCKNRAWAALGPREYSLDRVVWTGKIPFEIKTVSARPDGFELEFTQPVDPATATDPEGYDVSQYRYNYHAKYGSPEIDHDGKENSSTSIKVAKAAVSADKMKVRLTLEGWKAGYVTAIRALDVANEAGKPLRNDSAWYTLNAIPK